MLTMQEAVHASMYALVKEKGSEAWQYSYAKVWRVRGQATAHTLDHLLAALTS